VRFLSYNLCISTHNFPKSVVAYCLSFPLSSSAVTVSMFVLSTERTVTCYLQSF